MTVSVCPVAVVAAPVERVWALLADPRQWDVWVDGHVERVEPPGSTRSGQTIVVSTPALGRRWIVTIAVDDVDEPSYRLRLTARLPFGVLERAQFACGAIDETTCRVTFG